MTKFFCVKTINLALIVGVAVPSWAQAAPSGPAIVSFSLPNASYKVPLPNGYCIPVGKYVEKAKLVAETDNDNRTDLTFYRCADMAAGADLTSWGMIKTPVNTVGVKAPTRTELFAELKTQIDPAAMKQLDDEAIKQAGPLAKRVFGQDLKVGMNTKAVGADKFGIYFAGTVTVTDAQNKTSTLAIAYAITVVNGGVFSVDVYSLFHDTRDVVDAVEKVEKETADFVNANGG